MDFDIRSLERQPDPYKQARALHRKISIGAINPNYVEIASFLGHEPSQLLYPNAFPTGIHFETLEEFDPRITYLLAWAGVKAGLHLWEDDERTQFLRGRPVTIAPFRYDYNQDILEDILPTLEQTDLHGWPRYALDMVERVIQGELDQRHLGWLYDIAQMDVHHGPDGMDRFYYATKPIEEYIWSIGKLLDISDLENSTVDGGYLQGIWTTQYNDYGPSPVPLGFYRKAKAVYLVTKCIADDFIEHNNIRAGSSTYSWPFRFNDSGGVRAPIQPQNPQPYVNFTYWQKLHREMAGPYAFPYLLAGN